MKRLLLLKPGVTSSRAVLGDYEVWFARACGDVALVPVELHAGAVAPALDGFDGVLMTGSPSSVTEPLPWAIAAVDLMLEAGARGKPVLGVCFGHQLLAWRAGAQVVRNPEGRELGTVEVALTEGGRRSPLFAGFPERFEVQATHEEQVVAPTQQMEVLAANPACGVQAFSLGPRVFGVQFHPEMDQTAIRYCIEAPSTRAEDRARAQTKETPWGARVLRQFSELC